MDIDTFGGVEGIVAIISLILFVFVQWPQIILRLKRSFGALIGASMFTWLPDGRTMIVEGFMSPDPNMMIGTFVGVLIIALVGTIIGSSVQKIAFPPY